MKKETNASRRTPVPGDEAPLLLTLLFPLLFYPMVQVESRLLFPLLIPLNIFGAAGTWAFSLYGTRAREEAGASDYRPGESPDFRQRPVSTPRLLEPSRAAAFFALLSGILIIASVALSIWRGLDIERGHRHHRQLADWIIRHVDPGEAIAGSGYGYVSTTGYLAGRRTVPLIETAQPSELAGFVRDAGSHWLILYEPILRLMNPELLPVMESELQGFTRVFEVRDDRGQRVQVFQKVD